jgi:hypothetical protein
MGEVQMGSKSAAARCFQTGEVFMFGHAASAVPTHGINSWTRPQISSGMSAPPMQPKDGVMVEIHRVCEILQRKKPPQDLFGLAGKKPIAE